MNQITITFGQDAPVNSYIRVRYLNPATNTIIAERQFVWKDQRQAPGQVTVGTPTGIAGERTAINFITAVTMDMNSTGIFTLLRNGNAVTIRATTAGYTFVPSFVSPSIPTVPGATETLSVFNPNAIDITSVTFSEFSQDPCNKVNVTVNTNIAIQEILTPIQQNVSSGSSFTFNFARGQNFAINVRNGSTLDMIGVNSPSIINVETDFLFNIYSSPSGGSFSAQYIGSYPHIFQYSIDNGQTWIYSGFFNGLIAGDYTVQIKDQFGCVKSKAFSIESFVAVEKSIYLSPSNSIRFKKFEDWTLNNGLFFPTEENTLSYEERKDVVHKYVHLIAEDDVIRIQFKSSYNFHNIFLKTITGSASQLSFSKLTENIGVKEKMTCNRYNLGNGKTGLYFTSGQRKDFDTNAVLGTYQLYGGLPAFGQKGNWLIIDNIWYLIEEIIYSESKEAEVLVYSSSFSASTDDVITVGSIYNILPYDVFEFSFFGENINDRSFIEIYCGDSSENAQKFYVSEFFESRKYETLNKYKRFEFWNDTNNDIYYSSGIKHRSYFEVLKIAALSDSTIDSHKTDTTALLLGSKIYAQIEIDFDPVPTSIMRMICIAVSHENLFIDGEGYVLSGEPEIEGPLEKSNLYVVKCKLFKTNTIYNLNANTTYGQASEVVETPALIDYGGGFIAD